MSIYDMLQDRRIFTMTDYYLDITSCNAVIGRIRYNYYDGEHLDNPLDVFLSYHDQHIQKQHPDIVIAFPEYFI